MATRVVVLVDCENVSARHWQDIWREARAAGRIVATKLVGDFSEGRLSGWLELARTEGLSPVMQLSGGRGKNSADIALAITAMDLLHAGGMDGFWLASSDRDLFPLVQRLAQSGKDVHVATRRADDRLAALACSVYRLPDEAITTKAAPPHPLLAAYRTVVTGNDPMLLSELAKLMRAYDQSLLPKGKAKRTLKASGLFAIDDSAAGCVVRLRAV